MGSKINETIIKMLCFFQNRNTKVKLWWLGGQFVSMATKIITTLKKIIIFILYFYQSFKLTAYHNFQIDTKK